jgi:hypothetical protein
VSIKLEYYYNLVREESPFKDINKSIDLLTLELINVNIIIAIGLVGLDERNSAT